MHTFASDPLCRATVMTTGNKALTARAIQRHYLELAEAHLGDGFMPPWAPEVCRQWRAVLDSLDGAPHSVATTLDWAIKRAVFEDWAQRSGIAWTSLPDWSHVFERLLAALAQTPFKDKSVKIEFILGAQSPIAPEVAALGPYLKARGMDWDRLRPFVQLRPALFEIDTRFGQVGPGGIFSAMDRQGVLHHAVSDVDRIEQAAAEPPAAGRARTRGQWISNLAGNDRQYACTWTRIIDFKGKRVLDLSDPFTEQADWKESDERSLWADPSSMDYRLMAMYQARRRRQAAETTLQTQYSQGQAVVIALIPSDAPRSLAGRPATVVSVGRDEQGPLYRLDVDEGHYPWRMGHLQPAAGPVASTT
jgi:hypothetical protein